MLEVCELIQRNSSAGSVLFKYRGAAALVVFKQLQRSSSAGSVLFLNRGAAAPKVCNSYTEEQQR